ncbi:zinc carboxypeptidase-like [Phlebotomus argentipes]|uniref:zinc carboxypeptidase-like n=1 Tax=Phlebotomus argentipes TaxID=94469 RepID=UPI0028937E41|nr:zinc carboxypeptidase-like [Phlebotomus argentipes]
MHLKSGLVAVLLLALVNAEPFKFDNYRVYTIAVQNDDQLNALKGLKTGPRFYEFIDEPKKSGQEIDIIVPPELHNEFESLVKEQELKIELSIPDLQKLIDRERPNKFASKAAEDFGWEDYHSVETIHEWLYSLEEQYEEVTVIKGGTTFEGREILGVNINRNPGQNPGIFIEANIHAREWITHASTTWIINKLLTATADEPGIFDIANNVNWYIFPLVNVDGYQYTRDHYRLWRKTRSTQGLICQGVDPNRNWGGYWEKGGIGSSDSMCSDTFAGSEEFSEVETRTLSEYVLSVRDNLNIYLAFHSAAQMILMPWGHTTDFIEDHNNQIELLEYTVNALTARHGTEYTYGPTYTTIYPTTGTSSDWAFYALGVPGFTYEFRGRNTETGERYSFVAPPDQIQPNAEEVLDSLVALVQKSRELGYM